MPARIDRLGWTALLLFGTGVACLAIGLATFEATSEGGFSTHAVGTPAYAALFTSNVDPVVRSWIVAGAALQALGVLSALALATFTARTPSSGPVRHPRRFAVSVAACAVVIAAGIVAQHIGVFGLPLGVGIDQFAVPEDDPEFLDAVRAADLTPPGVEWLVAAAGLITLAGLACLLVLTRRWLEMRSPRSDRT